MKNRKITTEDALRMMRNMSSGGSGGASSSPPTATALSVTYPYNSGRYAAGYINSAGSINIRTNDAIQAGKTMNFALGCVYTC